MNLDLDDVYGVAVTRINRADIEMTAIPALRIQFGDVLQVVGEEQAIAKVAKLMGNSVKTLNETNFIPIFIGIALGVLFGSMPIHIPNMPVPVRLGIAGGPLVLAIILSRIGRIGPLVWHMPANANMAFRELGIVLVPGLRGLESGGQILRHGLHASGSALAARGLRHHGHPDPDHWSGCPVGLQTQFHRHQRYAGRQHDRSAGPGVRQRRQFFRCTGGFVCDCVSLNHAAAHPQRPDPGPDFLPVARIAPISGPF